MASSRNSPREALAARVAARIVPGTSVCAGLSGGLDSVVLLELLAGLRETHGLALSAVHVHHGLSPHADAWASACERLCAALGVPLAVVRVRVERDGALGLEAAAREARYCAFAAQGAAVVALAHHLDDQAETVLLQLLRGAGLKGVAAMPYWRQLPGTPVALFRPLLDCTRSELVAHARERGLEWIEDESNESSAFDRNFLRLEVAPLLDARFPAWRRSLARFARHAASADAILGELGREAATGEQGLAIGQLRGQAEGLQVHAIRAFLAANALPMPSEARLGEMTRQLIGAREDAQVRLEHGGAALVRHRGEVLVDRGSRPQPWSLAWAGEDEVALGADRGAVRFAAATGAGIAERYTHDRGWRFGSRDGGERLRLDPARPTRTLKNLLQENDVPAWQRERLPLLFHGEALVWVPGIGIAAGYRCAADEPGRVPEWLPRGVEP